MTFFQLFTTVGAIKVLSYVTWFLSLILFLKGDATFLVAIILTIYEVKYSLLQTAFRSKYILDKRSYRLISRIMVLGFCIFTIIYFNKGLNLVPMVIFGFSAVVWTGYSYLGPSLERKLGGKWIFIENLSSFLSSISILLMLVVSSHIFNIQDVIYFIILRSPLQFFIAYCIGATFYKSSLCVNKTASIIPIGAEVITFSVVILFIIFKVSAFELISDLHDGSDKIREVIIVYDILSVFCALLVRWLIVKQKKDKLSLLVLIFTAGLLIVSFILNFTLLNADYYIFIVTLLSLSLSYQNFLRDYALYQFTFLIALSAAAVSLHVFMVPAMLVLQAFLVLNNFIFNEYSN